ncbi:MAG: RNA polymerase sigma factor [Gemmatimonadota bacterium]
MSEASYDDLEAPVARAREGSRDALEEIVLAIQDDVYGLSLRMLFDPEDARDATQEILMRVITHLGTFRGESAFRTWVYRVAANHLLTRRKRAAERVTMSFEEFGEDLYDGLSDVLPTGTDAEQRLLVEEAKRSCTLAMLLCLDREQRIAYALAEALGLSSKQAAEVLDIESAAFRKRLSRAREAVRSFMRRRCGLVNKDSACRCSRRVSRAIELGRIDPEKVAFARHPVRGAAPGVELGIREMEALEYSAADLHCAPRYAAPASLIQGVRDLVDSGRFMLLS